MKKQGMSIKLINGNPAISSTGTVVSKFMLFYADIGPAYLKAPIKTSQQYSYIRYVLRKVN
jgi:hypothetical protein